MNKGLKIVIIGLALIMVIILIAPKMMESEFATIGEVEDKLQTSRESITQNEEEEQEEDAYDNAQDEEKEDKLEETIDQEVVETMKVVKDILIVNKTYGLPEDYNPGEDIEAVEQLNK